MLIFTIWQPVATGGNRWQPVATSGNRWQQILFHNLCVKFFEILITIVPSSEIISHHKFIF